MEKIKNTRGGIEIIIALIIIIILGGVLLVGGVAPNLSRPSTDNSIFTPDESILKGSQKNLQLKTIKFNSCTSTTAIGFLVDQSGSMKFGGGVKETNLKNALNRFTGSFPDEGILGLRTYSDDTYSPIVVPFDFYKNNNSQIASAITGMTPYKATHSKTAFEDMKRDLATARAKFPNYQFNLIFISDGIPESQKALDDFCPNGYDNSNKTYCRRHPDYPAQQCRCFAPDQDPTQVASEINASGVRIFSIVYLDDIDEVFRNQLKTLMENVSSDPATDYFEAPFDSQLDKILDDISVKICK